MFQTIVTAPKPKSSYVPKFYRSATEMVQDIRCKAIRCVEVVSACFDRIEETKQLNCIVESLKESALEQAQAVDDKISKGEPLRPLEGLPIVVKCNIHGPTGSLCTAGTPALANHRPKSVAPVVQSILNQGAIIIAKVHMPDLASGFNGRSGLHGRCLNPHNTSFNCGGSSSGTAVSIAAGIVSCGLGTDTGGSCRIPASLNGICGMRPTCKRLSIDGIVPCSVSVDTPGPLGTCVGDLCVLDAAMTNTTPVTERDLSGLKFAIPIDWIRSKVKSGLSEAVQKSIEYTKAALASVGAEVVEMDFLPVIESDKAQWLSPALPFVFDNSHEGLNNYLDSLGDERPVTAVEDILAKITNLGVVQKFSKPKAEPAALLQKVADRDKARAQMEAAYRAFFRDNGVCALLMPAFPNEITKIDSDNESRAEFVNEFLFVLHMNEIRVPSLTMPVHAVRHEESGVPCSLLLYGVEDRDLLGLALGVEEALEDMEDS